MKHHHYRNIIDCVWGGQRTSPISPRTILNKVAELEFYSNPFCDSEEDSGLVQVLPVERIPMRGLGFDSNVVLSQVQEQYACAENNLDSSCAEKAFDERGDTFWSGSCKANSACGRESHYIGLYYDTPKIVLCFKLWQHANPEYAVSTVHISAWDGKGGWNIPKP